MTPVRKLANKFLQHRYGLTLGVYLGAAAVTGIACVLFMWAFDFVLEHQLTVERIGAWRWVATPALFLIAVELIRRCAPHADGTGIPQTVLASQHMTETNERKLTPLVSARTMAVKVAALLLGLWAGASTGREGPTVHLAACLFFGLVLAARRWTRLPFDMRSAVVAGGAAGLAAAFNTPLAGVTFAIEELTTDYFSAIKDFVLMAIVVAGLAAQALTGEYAYFGRLDIPAPVGLAALMLIGIGAGAMGAAFSTILLGGKRAISGLGGPWARYGLPAVLACALLAVADAGGPGLLGPGNDVAQTLVSGQPMDAVAAYPMWKMLATWLTYWSGIAGGIFAPCLAMGAAAGAWLGQLLHAPLAGSALIGMAAFLSGAIQAPITAFVIIFEMTGHHEMLHQIMLASLLAFMTARLLRARHFYQTVADQYAKQFSVGKAHA